MQIVLFKKNQFSMNTVELSKTYIFQAIQFIYTVLIQFSISIDYLLS